MTDADGHRTCTCPAARRQCGGQRCQHIHAVPSKCSGWSHLRTDCGMAVRGQGLAKCRGNGKGPEQSGEGWAWRAAASKVSKGRRVQDSSGRRRHEGFGGRLRRAAGARPRRHLVALASGHFYSGVRPSSRGSTGIFLFPARLDCLEEGPASERPLRTIGASELGMSACGLGHCTAPPQPHAMLNRPGAIECNVSLPRRAPRLRRQDREGCEHGRLGFCGLKTLE